MEADMAAKIISRSEKTFTIQIEVPYAKSMLQSEETIQVCLNEGGVLATQEVLGKFDSDGSPILIGKTKLTSKGKVYKIYQSAYGEVEIKRHVYQTSAGGRMFCPLEKDARIIGTCTPKFAKIISHKYSDLGALRVMRDLEENHGRKIVRSFVQNISELVGLVATAKEENWEYELPPSDAAIKTISVGMDGTCTLMCEDGWRETMVGTIGYFDGDGNRVHTTYCAAIPEYGKSNFLTRLEREVSRSKEQFPKAHFIGLADGAKANWDFLETHTETQILDFWHAAGYLGKAADAMFKGKTRNQAKAEWLDDACHKLKNTQGSASRLLTEMKEFIDSKKMSSEDRTQLNEAITYFNNQKSRMKYAKHVEDGFPIGSGITESACKVIVKQRLCNSGMKWEKTGASVVLSLRCLTYSVNRWEQFWQKIDQYGLSLAA
jgi:hypothetical protein